MTFSFNYNIKINDFKIKNYNKLYYQNNLLIIKYNFFEFVIILFTFIKFLYYYFPNYLF